MDFSKALFSTACALVVSLFTLAQQPVKQGWHLLDKDQDGYHGISLRQAYDFLKGKKARTVIVGVIDGGTDTTHEDLRQVLWANSREIPGNGIDDDGNGFPDDYRGWNFLGNRKGENVGKENLEAVRLYHTLRTVFENKNIDPANLQGEALNQYRVWQKIENKLTVSQEDRFNYRLIKATTESLARQDSLLQAAMGKKVYTIAELEKASLDDNAAKRARFSFLRTAAMLEFEADRTNADIMGDLHEYLEQQEGLMEAKEKPLVNYRAIVGDNVDDIKDLHYGNSDVMGPEAKHGTHVAGIIAAVRNNGTGIDGVADNVKIMTIRAVPNGDEYDKDIALAIRYAVDNGAKVINMSFGKEFSPRKKWVDEAIAYAASKDVLLVHAAGNESKDLDGADNFPSPRIGENEMAANMITVGASGDESLKTGMIANFTNYGKNAVDVFAPGVKIYAPIPTGDRYSFQDGTSMAAPVVSGIAALIRGYFPALTAAEVKQVLMQSADTSLRNKTFTKPGDDKEKIAMADLCITGGIVNAYAALQLAEKMAEAKKK